MFCVHQFKVVLRGISPMIWRQLLLRSDQSIADLHYCYESRSAQKRRSRLSKASSISHLATLQVTLSDTLTA